MYNRHPKPGSAPQNGTPFICRLIPFVCSKNTAIIPLVCKKQPIVCIRGFSLIELIVAVTIIGILAAVAATPLSRFVSNNRLAGQINELIADITLSRSEAIKRNTTTGVCVTAVGGSTCVAAGNWANGWLTYYVCPDTDTSCTAGTNVALKTHETLAGQNTLTGPADAVIYGKSGVLSTGTGAFTLCDPGMKKTRVLTLLPTGRPTLSEGTCP